MKKEAMDIRNAKMKELHELQDKQMQDRKFRIEDATAKGDTTMYWQSITAAQESAYVIFLNLKGKAAAAMRGRARVTLKKTQLKPK